MTTNCQYLFHNHQGIPSGQQNIITMDSANRNFVWEEQAPNNGMAKTDSSGSLSSISTSHSDKETDWDADQISSFLSRNFTARPNTANAETNGFSIVTWNIWFSQYHWRNRLCVTLLETLSQQPDVFCFQEVTRQAHSVLLNCAFLRERYEPTEESLPCSYDCAVWVRKGVSVESVSNIPLPSIYGRRGLCVEVKKNIGETQQQIRIITTHLESGKGMEHTRRAQLQDINKFQSKCPYPTFLVGDMNLDPSYPENECLPGLDLWSHCHKRDPGFTEDTYVNRMRYNHHGQKHKQVRYDRILLMNSNPPPTEVQIQRLGTQAFRNKENEEVVWPSDHFGLAVQVLFCPAAGEEETKWWNFF